MVQKIKICVAYLLICYASSAGATTVSFGLLDSIGDLAFTQIEGEMHHVYIQIAFGTSTTIDVVKSSGVSWLGSPWVSGSVTQDKVCSYSASNGVTVHFVYNPGSTAITRNIKITWDSDVVETPQVEIYDFSNDVNEYNEVMPGMVKLQYLDPNTGEWVTIKMMYSTGKESVLDDPLTYSWGSIEAPADIVDWRVGYDYGQNTEIESAIDTIYGSGSSDAGNLYWMESTDDGFTYNGGIDLIAPIDTPSSYTSSVAPDTGGVTTIYSGAIETSSGISNVPTSTNDLINAAVSYAAGVRLAMPDLTKAVKDGVNAGMDGLQISGGASAAEIENIIDNVGTGENVDFAVDESHYSGVSTNIGLTAGNASIDGMAATVEGFASGISRPIFPTGFSSVSSLNFTLGGSTCNMDFTNDMWVSLRSMLTWMVHIMFFIGTITLIRRGIA